MAKKVAAKRTVAMKTPADLLAWLWACLGAEWLVRVSEEKTWKISRYSRTEVIEFGFSVYHGDSECHASSRASTILDLANHFRTVSWPELQADFAKWVATTRPKAISVNSQIVIESRQPRLEQKQRALTSQTQRGLPFRGAES
jgi:hypothetical protein